MKPILYDKTGKTQLGVLEHCITCFTEEERNGGFTLTLTYPITDELHHHLIYENIIVVKANDEHDNQMFRIATTERVIKGTVTVLALHISYDLNHDFIYGGIYLDNSTCQNALNELFSKSEFSKDFKGYSDIKNPQSYNVLNINIWEAIVGNTGSIIDTFGNGAEIVRDNKNIHVLNNRGADNNVVIEYSINMLDESLQVDTTGVITRIYPFANYTREDNMEITVAGPQVNSGLINAYAHPYIASIDYSDRFTDSNTPPTEEILAALAANEFLTNGVDQPKCNYTINFVSLSKCAGYENIQDEIHLCDTVTIIDSRYNINTKSKVIKYKYNVLTERYESMELGDAKRALWDTITDPSVSQLKEQIKNIVVIDNKNYPDILPGPPSVNVISNLGSLEINWTIDNKPYYTYELYGSTSKGFTPSNSNLLYSGQGSSFTHKVTPKTTYYYKARVKNTYGRYTAFSAEAEGTSEIIEGDTPYVEEEGLDGKYVGVNGDNLNNVVDSIYLEIDSLNIVTEELNIDIVSKVDKSSVVASINASQEGIKIQASKIDISGCVTFSDLSTSGKTTINGANITTGYISGDRIKGGTISAADEINFVNGCRIFSSDYGLYVSASTYAFTGASYSYINGAWGVHGYIDCDSYINCSSLYATSAVYANNVALTSDKKKKKDIKYVNKDKQEQSKETGLMAPNVNITTSDMHEFVETLPLASYRFTDELDEGKDFTYYGFIAQDIIETKVGSELVAYDKRTKVIERVDENGNVSSIEEEEDILVYSDNKFISFICGALQEEIKLRKELEARVNKLDKDKEKK